MWKHFALTLMFVTTLALTISNNKWRSYEPGYQIAQAASTNVKCPKGSHWNTHQMQCVSN